MEADGFAIEGNDVFMSSDGYTFEGEGDGIGLSRSDVDYTVHPLNRVDLNPIRL